MYAGIIIWSLCGGCRSTERLYFLKYCNPHLFCFFTRTTALRSLSDYNGKDLKVALVSRWFLYLCVRLVFVESFLNCLLYISSTVSNNIEPNAGKHNVSITFSLNSRSCPLCSAAVQQPKQVTFMVELGNSVSEIHPFILAGDLHSTEKGSHNLVWSDKAQLNS